MDYYKVLGVSKNASKEEIRKAFKKIARENHPDAKPDDTAAAEKFKQAAEAYDVLGDEEKRKKYDQYGENWKHVPEGGGFPGGGSPFRSGGPVDVDLRDIFGGGGGGVDLESLFGGMFGGGGRQQARQRAQRGQDLKTVIMVPFEVAARGGEHDITISQSGNVQRVSVKIPAGIESGKSVRLTGQGQPGVAGGPPGDVLVTVNVASHPYFRREGNNLLVDVPVTITEAVLGAKIDVPTIDDGVVTMTLPAGTSSGAKLRLKGKGFKNLKTKVTGDQYVVIKIQVPKEIDERSQELMTEFAELNATDIRGELW